MRRYSSTIWPAQSTYNPAVNRIGRFTKTISKIIANSPLLFPLPSFGLPDYMDRRGIGPVTLPVSPSPAKRPRTDLHLALAYMSPAKGRDRLARFGNPSEVGFRRTMNNPGKGKVVLSPAARKRKSPPKDSEGMIKSLVMRKSDREVEEGRKEQEYEVDGINANVQTNGRRFAASTGYQDEYSTDLRYSKGQTPILKRKRHLVIPEEWAVTPPRNSGFDLSIPGKKRPAVKEKGVSSVHAPPKAKPVILPSSLPPPAQKKNSLESTISAEEAGRLKRVMYSRAQDLLLEIAELERQLTEEEERRKLEEGKWESIREDAARVIDPGIILTGGEGAEDGSIAQLMWVSLSLWNDFIVLDSY